MSKEVEFREQYPWESNAMYRLKATLLGSEGTDEFRRGVECVFEGIDRILPSRFQVGDMVSVRFRPALVIDTAEVIKVHFTASKVLYDLEVRIPLEGDFDHPEGYTTTRFYNVDSAILSEV